MAPTTALAIDQHMTGGGGGGGGKAVRRGSGSGTTLGSAQAGCGVGLPAVGSLHSLVAWF